MEKIRKKHHKLFVLLGFACNIVFAQAKSGMENYNLLAKGQDYCWTPVLSYEASSGFVTQLRYNYEDLKTISFFAGKKMTTGKSGGLEIAPMLGISAGTFAGVSLACNTEAEGKRFYFSSEMQYSKSTKKGINDFFFTWSEAGISVGDYFFGGAAMQLTLEARDTDLQPGLVAGLSFGRLTLPLYVFRPFSAGQWFLAGVNYEFQCHKKRFRTDQ